MIKISFQEQVKENEKRNDYMENKKPKMCPCGKSSVKKTELKDVYQCVVCNLIINERLDDREKWQNIEEKK